MTKRNLIVIAEKHKVKTGESLDGIAKANGLTWQKLADFNWGTTEPNEINRCLKNRVGCTRKTADGKNYIFDSSDDPGILYVPKPWRLSGLDVRRTHVVRVHVIPQGESETFSGVIRTSAGPLRNWPFELKRDGRSVDQAALAGTSPNPFRKGWWLSDKEGAFLFRNIPAGNYTVEVILPGGKLVINEELPPPPANEGGLRSEPADPHDRTAFTEDPEDLSEET